MKKTMKMERGRIGINELDREAIGEGISQTGLAVLVALATLVGLWGVACLVGGFGQSHGMMDLARGWLTAVTGGM